MPLKTITRANGGMIARTLALSTCLSMFSGHATATLTGTLPPEVFVASAESFGWQSTDAQVENSESSGWQSAIVQDDQYQFNFLTSKWREERGVSSSTTEIAMCPSYQKIIAMGEIAIPLILAKLASEGDEPDMWFWALRVISNEDPVADSDRGNLTAMATAWLRWGQDRYAW